MATKVKEKVAPLPETLRIGQENVRHMVVPLSQIRVDWNKNPRGGEEEVRKEIAILKAAMKRTGKALVVPFLVQAVDGKTFELRDGFRRYAAAEALGLKEVPVVVLPHDAAEADVRLLLNSLNSNDARLDINPMKLARRLVEDIEMQRKAGYTDAAERVRTASGISKARFEALLKLAQAPARVQVMVEREGASLDAVLQFTDDEGKWMDEDTIQQVVEKLPKTRQRISAADVASAINALIEDRAEVEEGEADDGEVSAATRAKDSALRDIPPRKAEMMETIGRLSEICAGAKNFDISFWDGNTVNPQAAAAFIAGALWAREGAILPLVGDTPSARERQVRIRRRLEYVILLNLVETYADQVTEEGYEKAIAALDGGNGRRALVDEKGTLSDKADKIMAILDAHVIEEEDEEEDEEEE